MEYRSLINTRRLGEMGEEGYLVRVINLTTRISAEFSSEVLGIVARYLR